MLLVEDGGEGGTGQKKTNNFLVMSERIADLGVGISRVNLV